MESNFRVLPRIRRGTIETYAEILTAAKQPILKQHIIQKCSLNNSVFTVYVKRLIDSKLLKANLYKERRVYQITSKGLEFLKRYNELLILLEMQG
jgi:predicted transcriptional regulator